MCAQGAGRVPRTNLFAGTISPTICPQLMDQLKDATQEDHTEDKKTRRGGIRRDKEPQHQTRNEQPNVQLVGQARDTAKTKRKQTDGIRGAETNVNRIGE